LSVFTVPFAFFLLVPQGVKVVYALWGFWILEIFLLLCVWIFLATTTYIIKPDWFEIRHGILVKRSWAIPYDKIINITCKQNPVQKLFNIGDLFIEIPGVEPFGVVLTGVEKHKEVADLFFALKKKGVACTDHQ
jgi:uncharacterized membrane protein YdbT with pleckstrin-like domain